jgi:hypothetical protein
MDDRGLGEGPTCGRYKFGAKDGSQNKPLKFRFTPIEDEKLS